MLIFTPTHFVSYSSKRSAPPPPAVWNQTLLVSVSRMQALAPLARLFLSGAVPHPMAALSVSPLEASLPRSFPRHLHMLIPHPFHTATPLAPRPFLPPTSVSPPLDIQACKALFRQRFCRAINPSELHRPVFHCPLLTPTSPRARLRSLRVGRAIPRAMSWYHASAGPSWIFYPSPCFLATVHLAVLS